MFTQACAGHWSPVAMMALHGSNEEGRLLLDELMPRYDVVERHRIVVDAPPEIVFRSIREADLSGNVVTRLLLAVRAAPAALIAFVRSPRAARDEYLDRTAKRVRGVRIQSFEEAGFRIVAERPPDELVIGLLGRFWTPRGAISREVSSDTFRTGPGAGQALAGWNFTVMRRPDGSSDLRTETRVWCADDARWKFRLYWLAVRPGSGLIRRAMLRAVRRHAERVSGASEA